MTPSGGYAIPPKAGALARTIRLMSEAKDDKLRSQLPKVNNAKLQQILDDPTLILYTDAEIPSAYQDWSSGLQGIHSPSYNVSANRSEPYGNGNVEFPWGAPAGTHRSGNVSTFRFLWLPRDEQGKPRPIVWYRRFLRGSSSQGYAWIFPVGSVVGEVLQLRSPTGQLYTFELRVRTRATGEWSVDVFRPFPTSGELVDRIKALRPEWQQNVQLAKLVDHLEQPIAMERRTLSDSNHSRRVFHQTMGVDRLPSAGDDQLVAQLLTETVFESALGATWRTGTNRVHTVAPTTDAAFHIVPARYDGGFIEVDRNSCMRCHETANHHVNEFQFGRDWYGRVRGSDGIFSIHPFDPSCISYSGFSQPARLNSDWISAGLLASFDPKTHSRDVYHQLDQSDE
jgi:hypothetical protein